MSSRSHCWMHPALLLHRICTMRTVLLIIVFLLVVFSPWAFCQQSYYTSQIADDCNVKHPEYAGYVCEPDTPSCETVAYFRVQSSVSSTLGTIASDLFSTNSSAIAAASGLSGSNAIALSEGQGLYIPLTCTCYGNHSSKNVSYTIVAGDTFYQLSKSNYEGLMTCQAIEDANPKAVPTDLQIGESVVIPIRCACPSAEQNSSGIHYLVTYPVADGDDIKSVVQRFGLVEQQFLAANSINASSPLFANTTVLLPFLVEPSNPPNMTSNLSAPSNASVQAPPSSSSSKTGIYVGVPLAIVALLLAVALAVLLFRHKREGAGRQLPLSSPSPQMSPHVKPSMPPSKNKDLQQGMMGLVNSDKFTSYTLEEIKEATQNFSPVTLIKGSVYRGVMKGQVVAVKNVTRNVTKELQILKKVHHANLVTLLGYCIVSPEQSYLVYEFAENGSLSDWLHDDDLSIGSGSTSALAWNHRLQIALDVATALEYIHNNTSPSYVHKDVKSSNILLNSKFRGKLANFTLAKQTSDEAVTRHIVGTQGYMAPEYLSQGLVSSKMDVFAFGVVLLEMLSGEEAVVRDRHGKEKFLSATIYLVLNDTSDEKESLRAWMDPHLQNVYPLDCAYSVALLAKSCVLDDVLARPDIRDIAYTLAKVLEISQEWDASAVLEGYSDNHLEAR